MLFVRCKCHLIPFQSLCLVLSVKNCLKYCCDLQVLGPFSVWSCQSVNNWRHITAIKHQYCKQPHMCLVFNTQLLPPYITAYSQFVESTESMDKINVPVTSLIKSKIPVAFVIHCFVSLSLITGPRFHH